MAKQKYKVKMRPTSLDINARWKLVEGKEYTFYQGWAVDRYGMMDEHAMIPHMGQQWPEFAPSWVPMGDLVAVD